MARFLVDVRLHQGWHSTRAVRARSAEAAYERVCRDLAEAHVDTTRGGEVTVVQQRRWRHGGKVVDPRGGSGGGPDTDGLAGVREPRRPKPGPPSLTMALELPRGT